MRRRVDAVLPRELLAFDGRGYATEAEWEEAFRAFLDARERWRTERGLPSVALPPWQVDGDCPFNSDSI